MVLVPARPGPRSYGSTFQGKEIADKARLNETSNLESFLSIWEGAKASKPRVAHNEDGSLPFIWEEKGVRYSSDCLAFDKNMWVAQGISNHWNQAIKLDKNPREAIERHLKPAIVLSNHL